MLTTSEVNETLHRFQEEIEEILTICRLHAYPAGSWQDLTDLPLRLSQDSGFRSDFSEIVRSMQREGLNLPDVLEVITAAIGGSTAPGHQRELREQLNSLGSFLSSIGRWPGTDVAPVLAPGEVPANLHKFMRPGGATASDDTFQPNSDQSNSGQSNSEAISDSAESLDTSDSASLDDEPAASTPTASDSSLSSLADIARALARLERGSLELRAHLDSIDQRISRMEPLLESTAAPASTPPLPHSSVAPPDPTPPPTLRQPAPKTFAESTTSARRQPDLPPALKLTPEEVRVEPSRPKPLNTPTFPTSEPTRNGSSVIPASSSSTSRELPSVDQSEIPAPAPASRPGEARPASGQRIAPPMTPRFSRFSIEADGNGAASLSPQSELPPGAEAFRTTPSDPLLHPAAEAAAKSDVSSLPDSFLSARLEPQRNRFGLIVTVVVLLTLTAGAVLLYLRYVAAEDVDRAFNVGGSKAGPLTTSPASPSAAGDPAKAKVLDARSSLLTKSSTEEPGSMNGFRPASTFVSASVMDGHLLSAPLPDQPRVPASAGSKGVVVMEANISSTGQVEDVHVLGGSPALRFAAIDAVRSWQYKPYLVNGHPTEVRTIIRVDFSEHVSQPATAGSTASTP